MKGNFLIDARQIPLSLTIMCAIRSCPKHADTKTLFSRAKLFCCISNVASPCHRKTISTSKSDDLMREWPEKKVCRQNIWKPFLQQGINWGAWILVGEHDDFHGRSVLWDVKPAKLVERSLQETKWQTCHKIGHFKMKYRRGKHAPFFLFYPLFRSLIRSTDGAKTTGARVWRAHARVSQPVKSGDYLLLCWFNPRLISFSLAQGWQVRFW